MNEDTHDMIERFELIAELYYKRFGEIAPGKDRPAAMGGQSDEDMQRNSSRFRRYVDDLAFKDLETEVLNLRDELARSNALLAELRRDRERLDALIRWMRESSPGMHKLPSDRPHIDHAIEVEADRKRRMEARDA